MRPVVEKLRRNMWLAVSHPHLRAVCESGIEAANEIEDLEKLLLEAEWLLRNDWETQEWIDRRVAFLDKMYEKTLLA